MSKEIVLTISDNYVGDWGIWEAVRELAQNAMDHADKEGISAIVGYHKRTKHFTFVSKNAKLDIKSLILGETSKANDNSSRGQFGEGYKLALVVLLRLGLNVTIKNQNELWHASLAWNEEFKCKLLTINIEETKSKNKDLVFMVGGMTQDMANKIKGRLIVKRDKAVGYKTKFGTILTEERMRGQVFVGGIYVCKPNLELEHGYDFDPEHVDLGRDRGLMDSFNVQWLAAKMWCNKIEPDTEYIEKTADMVIRGTRETTYIGNSSYNDEIIEKVAESFYKEYPATAIPVTHETARQKKLKEYDNAVPVVVPEQVYNTVTRSEIYHEHKKLLKERLVMTPNEVITEILAKYKGELGNDLHNRLTQELIGISLRWKVDDAYVE